jgi:hypothetical protein
MEKDNRKVVFARKELEGNYKRLARSQNREDRKSYRVLQRIRRELRMQHRSGRRIPTNNIPSIYNRMFDINNLWRLDVPGGGTVLYSVMGQELRIIDIV